LGKTGKNGDRPRFFPDLPHAFIFWEKNVVCPRFSPFLGIPLVFFGSRTRIKLPYNALLGSLSYGVFLAHFLVIWILDYLWPAGAIPTLQVPAVTLGSVGIAWAGVRYLETRVDRIRKSN
jgi:peptidoglycan/LPS O-acetylase OafA/YrhL